MLVMIGIFEVWLILIMMYLNCDIKVSNIECVLKICWCVDILRNWFKVWNNLR